MSYDVKKTILSATVMVILMLSILGQTFPASGATLVKRDYSYLNDQHLTARFGNSMVCGDHMCAPGEWSKMQEHLNQSQIVHGAGKNVVPASTNSTVKTNPVSSTNSTVKTNSTSSTDSVSSSIPTPSVSPSPIPIPIPTPSPVPYSVCNTVKSVLANSTIPSSVVGKIMTSLGCS
ncbi:MAG: hypothetical protein KGI28_01840 [Thaumarchaeota archaeon]|nr:hypothetical protein [Nitrososphaerota archaeon]